MKNATQTLATSSFIKALFATLSVATVVTFAGGLKAAEQQAVAQAAAEKMEVRVVEPIVVVARRDIRLAERIEVVAHRS